MITIDDLLKPQPTTDAAKNMIKKYYEYHCIFTELCSKEFGHDDEKITLDGCHILDAGIVRFEYFINIPANIIPAIRKKHNGGDNTLDYIRKPSKKRKPIDKIQYIYDHASHKFKDIVQEQIGALMDLCDERGVKI